MGFSKNLVAELVGQLLLYLLHFAGLAVVAQGARHLLICHFFSVSLLDPPAVGQGLLVFGGELKGALVSVHPPDALLHVSVPQEVQQELVQADLLLAACWRRFTAPC